MRRDGKAALRMNLCDDFRDVQRGGDGCLQINAEQVPDVFRV